MPTFIEAADEKYLLQVNRFCERIDTYSATLGLDPIKLAAVKADNDFFRKTFVFMDAFHGFAESFTKYKNLLRYGNGTEVLGVLGEPQPPRPIYIELPEGPYNSMRRAVIDHGWKLIERGTGRFELYDLARDPGERADLARTNAAELSRMRGVLESVRAGLHVVQARE
ncbi:MAG: hypothetical protein WCJ30_21255 [Deltaproteobacteria bacterium]